MGYSNYWNHLAFKFSTKHLGVISFSFIVTRLFLHWNQVRASLEQWKSIITFESTSSSFLTNQWLVEPLKIDNLILLWYNHTMGAKPTLRELNSEEKAIIDTLLEKEFKGRDEIKEQLKNASVSSAGCLCECLSIEFSVQSDIVLPTKERVPVEARYYRGKLPFQILLHVVDGKVNELEFVSYADDADKEYPRVSDLEIVINEKNY